MLSVHLLCIFALGTAKQALGELSHFVCCESLILLSAAHAALSAACGGVCHFVEIVFEEVDCFRGAEYLCVIRVVQAVLIKLVLILRVRGRVDLLPLRKQSISTVRILGSLDSAL